MHFSESRTYVRLKFNWGPNSPDPLGRFASNWVAALRICFEFSETLSVLCSKFDVVSCFSESRTYVRLKFNWGPYSPDPLGRFASNWVAALRICFEFSETLSVLCSKFDVVSCFSESRTYVRLKFNWGPYSPDPLGRFASNWVAALRICFEFSETLSVLCSKFDVVSCFSESRTYVRLKFNWGPDSPDPLGRFASNWVASLRI